MYQVNTLFTLCLFYKHQTSLVKTDNNPAYRLHLVDQSRKKTKQTMFVLCFSTYNKLTTMNWTFN